MTQAIETQHAELRLVVDRILLESNAREATLSTTRTRHVLLHDLRELTKTLEKHFVFEEKGGYMQAVLDKNPNKHEEVARLLSQHGDLRRELARIIADLEQGAVPEKEVGRIRHVMALLRAHEQAETILLRDTFNTDLGLGD